MLAAPVVAWLNEHVRQFRNPDQTLEELTKVLERFPSLQPGSTGSFLLIAGPLPVSIGGQRYGIPIEIRLEPDFPLQYPQIWIKPTAEMRVFATAYNTSDGKCLFAWPGALVTILVHLASEFSKSPPVYSVRPPPVPPKRPSLGPPVPPKAGGPGVSQPIRSPPAQQHGQLAGSQSQLGLSSAIQSPVISSPASQSPAMQPPPSMQSPAIIKPPVPPVPGIPASQGQGYESPLNPGNPYYSPAQLPSKILAQPSRTPLVPLMPSHGMPLQRVEVQAPIRPQAVQSNPTHIHAQNSIQSSPKAPVDVMSLDQPIGQSATLNRSELEMSKARDKLKGDMNNVSMELQTEASKNMAALQHTAQYLDFVEGAVREETHQLAFAQQKAKENTHELTLATQRARDLTSQALTDVPPAPLAVVAPMDRAKLEAWATDKAISDTIYALGRALDAEKVSVDAYTKQIRALAREQFRARAGD